MADKLIGTRRVEQPVGPASTGRARYPLDLVARGNGRVTSTRVQHEPLPSATTTPHRSRSRTFVLGRVATVIDNTTHSILKANPQILAYLAKSGQLQRHVHD